MSRVPLRLDEIMPFRHTLTAQGQMRPLDSMLMLSPLLRGNSNNQELFMTRKMANAGHQQPTARPDDGQRTVNKQQTVLREEYIETTERGVGLLHGFVSAFYVYRPGT